MPNAPVHIKSKTKGPVHGFGVIYETESEWLGWIEARSQDGKTSPAL